MKAWLVESFKATKLKAGLFSSALLRALARVLRLVSRALPETK
jgi:hypothetical protein